MVSSMFYYLSFLALVTSIMFFYSNSNSIMLLNLFLYTIFSSFMYYYIIMNFWFSSLLLIVMITGLFIVFTYMTSVTPEVPSTSNISFTKIFLPILVILSSFFFNKFWDLGVVRKSVLILDNSLTGNSFVTSTMLITLLLLLVICFIRLIYSKGGSLRKKF